MNRLLIRHAKSSFGHRSAWPRIGSRYGWALTVIVCGLIAYFCIENPNQKDSWTLFLSSSIIILACAPMVYFLSRGRVNQIPIMEGHGLFYAVCFGISGYQPARSWAGGISITNADVETALECVLVGLVALALGYYLVGASLLRRVRPIHPGRNIPSRKLAKLGWAASAAGIAGIYLNQAALGQIAGLVFSLGFYALLVLAFERKIALWERSLVLGIALPSFLFQVSGLNNGQLAGLAVTAYWISFVILRAKGRIPVSIISAAFLFFFIFQPVKFHVRTLILGADKPPSPLETVRMYADGFANVYGSLRIFQQEGSEVFETSFDRINHLATTAAIIRDTPSRMPYLWGASYMPLLTKIIPRAVWKGKPTEDFGNRWASRYGYIATDDYGTSFNLPWLPEMFMNFGWTGVAVIMLLQGVIYRALWHWLMENPDQPAEYAIAVVYAQPLVLVESNLSMFMGKILILTVIVMVIGAAIRFWNLLKADMPQTSESPVNKRNRFFTP